MENPVLRTNDHTTDHKTSVILTSWHIFLVQVIEEKYEGGIIHIIKFNLDFYFRNIFHARITYVKSKECEKMRNMGTITELYEILNKTDIFFNYLKIYFL